MLIEGIYLCLITETLRVLIYYLQHCHSGHLDLLSLLRYLGLDHLYLVLE